MCGYYSRAATNQDAASIRINTVVQFLYKLKHALSMKNPWCSVGLHKLTIDTGLSVYPVPYIQLGQIVLFLRYYHNCVGVRWGYNT